jgi:integrase
MSMDAGIDPKIVSDRVGHANMQVTFQVYTHRSTGRDREAAERMGDLIQRAISRDNGPAT